MGLVKYKQKCHTVEEVDVDAIILTGVQHQIRRLDQEVCVGEILVFFIEIST